MMNRYVLYGMLLLVVIFTGCDRTDTKNPLPSEIAITNTPSEGSFMTASEAVANMGVGWNLGNSLDSSNYLRYTAETLHYKMMDYQMMAVYENQVWDGWDASPTPFFSADGTVELNWEITSLNSSLSGASGKFMVQLINNEMNNIDGANIEFSIVKAEFVTRAGMVIVLNEVLGEYEATFQNQVTSYISADLTSISLLQTAADLIGGTLILQVQITEYPTPAEAFNPRAAVEYYETLWGNPVTTEAMITAVAEAGFGAVRVPVTYYDHMDDHNNIDSQWLARVKEVVDYVLDNDMYAVINIHHDTGTDAWIYADMATVDTHKHNLSMVWSQIATYFKNYDQRLIFEGFNEILNADNEWTNPSSDDREAVNQLNQVFVDTVRATGGSNAERNLIVHTYAASASQEALDSFRLVSDSVSDHLIASMHFYSELNIEAERVTAMFQRLNQTFIEDGVPVIIGEFASFNNWSEAESIPYVRAFIEEATRNNVVVFWWDRGGPRITSDSQTETLLNRNELVWYSESLLDAIFLR